VVIAVVALGFVLCSGFASFLTQALHR
jgi:hypothetical protein